MALTLLDGGMGHLLKESAWGVQAVSGLPFDQQFLASCLALEGSPDTVYQAHAAYIAAGCGVITTNNFVATSYSLAKVQRTPADALSFVAEAGRLARKAAAQAGAQQQVLVAGSLPPLRESYQTDGLPSQDVMQQEYAAIAAALQPHVDVFLAETLSTAAEAQAALQAAAQAAPGMPVWVSFTLEDSTACCLRDKQPLAAAVQQLTDRANLTAVLVNCCAPTAVAAAIPVLKQHLPSGVRIGCYANGFKTTTTQWLKGAGDDDTLLQQPAGDYGADGIITPEAYLRHAKQWVSAGATIVGGCCGIGPQHIKLLHQELGSVTAGQGSNDQDHKQSRE